MTSQYRKYECTCIIWITGNNWNSTCTVCKDTQDRYYNSIILRNIFSKYGKVISILGSTSIWLHQWECLLRFAYQWQWIKLPSTLYIYTCNACLLHGGYGNLSQSCGWCGCVLWDMSLHYAWGLTICLINTKQKYYRLPSGYPWLWLCS